MQHVCRGLLPIAGIAAVVFEGPRAFDRCVKIRSHPEKSRNEHVTRTVGAGYSRRIGLALALLSAARERHVIDLEPTESRRRRMDGWRLALPFANV